MISLSISLQPQAEQRHIAIIIILGRELHSMICLLQLQMACTAQALKTSTAGLGAGLAQSATNCQ